MSHAQFLSPMLASGGDRRIAVERGGNTNIYGASPFPRSTLGYASSTANDISFEAFRHLQDLVQGWPSGGLQTPCAYRDMLEAFRHRIRAAWQLDTGVEVVFAPSGTDLEYVALALAADASGAPVTNILLGQDEVGSGCALSAGGRYFAKETAVCAMTQKGAPVPGFEHAEIAQVPVRDSAGAPCTSEEIAGRIDGIARKARQAGRHVLAHVVHGSKTGLILPGLAEIDRLKALHAERLSFVVDACQARIDGEQIRAYLERGCIVLLTGSKFIGGPPFCGFALVPAGLRPRGRLPEGLAAIFRRGEWPLDWAGCGHLPATANPGLLLRLEAALFELERFQQVAPAARQCVIGEFGKSVSALARRLDAGIVSPALAGDGLHVSTLATLDLSALPGSPDFAVTQRWHRVLAARGLRLGQPVKCVRHGASGWAGTLRISLSMPLISTLAAHDREALAGKFARDMAQIANVIEAAQRPVVA